jgi:hypothetical protein
MCVNIFLLLNIIFLLKYTTFYFPGKDFLLELIFRLYFGRDDNFFKPA